MTSSYDRFATQTMLLLKDALRRMADLEEALEISQARVAELEDASATDK